jgi:hypothetical protein
VAGLNIILRSFLAVVVGLQLCVCPDDTCLRPAQSAALPDDCCGDDSCENQPQHLPCRCPPVACACQPTAVVKSQLEFDQQLQPHACLAVVSFNAPNGFNELPGSASEFPGLLISNGSPYPHPSVLLLI